MSGKQYPVGTYDPPGSDPKNPGNSRFTKGNSSITSGPAKDPNHKGNTGVFEYFTGFFGQFLNPPPASNN